jgi:hypothetical protein
MFTTIAMTNQIKGRGFEYDEPLNRTVRVQFTPKQHAELKEKTKGKDLSTWIRRVVLGEEAGPLPAVPVDLGLLNLVNLRLLTAAPCGDWEEAVDHAGEFTLSRDVAEYMGITSEHVIVKALNISMEGAGIYDGDLLAMERLSEHAEPLRNEITLVQIISGGGAFATIKRWGKSGAPPQLLDGNDEAVTYPDDIISVRPVAVVKGIIGRR